MEQKFFDPEFENGSIVYHARLPLEAASNRKLHCWVGVAIIQQEGKYALAEINYDSFAKCTDEIGPISLLTNYDYDTICPLYGCAYGGYFAGCVDGKFCLLRLVADAPNRGYSVCCEEVTSAEYDCITASSWYTITLYSNAMRTIYNIKTGELSDVFCGKPLPSLLQEKYKLQERLQSFSEELCSWYYRSTRERKNVYRLHPFDNLQEFAYICCKPGITLLISHPCSDAEVLAQFLRNGKATIYYDSEEASMGSQQMAENCKLIDFRKLFWNPSAMRKLRQSAIDTNQQIFMIIATPKRYRKLYSATGRHLQFRDILTLGPGVRCVDQALLLHRDRYYCDSIPDYSPIAHTLEVKYQAEDMRRIFYLPWDYTSEDDPCRIKLGWEHKKPQ